MLDKDAITRVADIIKIEDFYRDTHGMIYSAMLELYEAREPIDVLSVSNRLEERGHIDTVGGPAALATLVNSVPSASNVTHYAKLVQRKATLRRLIGAGADIAEMGYDESEDVERQLDEAEQRLFKVSQKFIKQDFVPIRPILEHAF
jgi:replicative DNA helicase